MGTVTFLFTDIEGSTKLLHQLRADGYAAALVEHRRLLRQAFASHGGVEVDTQGDAFFVAFASAPRAVAAAAAAQAVLASGPIRVRMGLHTGTPHVVDDGYVGEDVHLGARVAAIGHGGQVLLSRQTRESVGVELTDLGEHRLKDFDQPLSIFQLGSERFPPLKTISNTNLPRPASSFVGRDREVSDVVELLRDSARLVTLRGPGGSGKTRLAIEVAATLVPEFKAGVFWVGLAAVRDPSLATDTIAQTLGAQEDLVVHVGERQLLLLLDNVEQVVQAAPELADLVEACPNLRLLVTSRELLHVRGEVDYPVLPLADPDAVELFCARAGVRAADDGVADLCRALDNLPLALELAAARAILFSPRQILDRISERLDLLKGRRDSDPRQQTLRGTIEWSYNLLAAEEQALFARLAVFAGGCTLEAVEEVGDADLDVMQALVEKSLIRRSGDRFWMLQTIRDYALEQLSNRKESSRLRTRHLAYYLRLAEQSDARIHGPEQPHVLDRLEAEEDNLRSALDWALTANPSRSQRLAAALGWFWQLRSRFGEGTAAVEAALSAETATPTRATQLLQALGRLTYYRGDPSAAQRLLEQAAAAAREANDHLALAQALSYVSIAAGHAGDEDRARSAGDSAIEIARTAGDAWTIGLACWALGANLVLGRCDGPDPSEARELLEESAAILRAAGDPWALGAPLVYLASLEEQAGAIEVAALLLDEASDLFRLVGDKWRLSVTLGRRAYIAETQGEKGVAAHLRRESEILESDLRRLSQPR